MGNQQTYINYYAPLNYSFNLNDQLTEEGVELHPSFGKIMIWKVKDSEERLIFSFHTHIFLEDTSILDIHNFRCSIEHPNLLQYYACAHNKSQNIGAVQSQQFFFEYYTQTLRKQIANTDFSELQIWKVIQQIVNVMSYLQKLGRYHGNLTSDAILLTDKNEIKLLDQLGQKPNDSSQKQDIYDLGIIGFEMLTKKTTQINFIEALKQLAGKYTLQLLQLIAAMVSKDPEKRPSFDQLKQLIAKRFQEAIHYTEKSQPIKQFSTQGSFFAPDYLSHRTLTSVPKQISQYPLNCLNISPRIILRPEQYRTYSSMEIKNNSSSFHNHYPQYSQQKNENYLSPPKTSKFNINQESTAAKLQISPQQQQNNAFVG